MHLPCLGLDELEMKVPSAVLNTHLLILIVVLALRGVLRGQIGLDFHLKVKVLLFFNDLALDLRDDLDSIRLVWDGIVDSLQHVTNEVLHAAHVHLRHGVIVEFVNLIDLLLYFLDLFLDIRHILGEIKVLNLVSEDDDLLFGSGLWNRWQGLNLDFLRYEDVVELWQLLFNIRYFLLWDERFNLENSLASLNANHRYEHLLSCDRNVNTLSHI